MSPQKRKSSTRRKPASRSRARNSKAWRTPDAETIRLGLGLVCMLFSVFLLVAVVSHVFNAYSDQSSIANGRQPVQEVGNHAGWLGAKLATLVMERGFGLGALAFPPFLALVGFALAYNTGWKAVRRWFWRLVPFVYLYGLFSSWTLALFGAPNAVYSGEIGQSLLDWLSTYIGMTGVGLLLAFVLVVLFAGRIQKLLGKASPKPFTQLVNAGRQWSQLATQWLQAQREATADRKASAAYQAEMADRETVVEAEPNARNQSPAPPQPAAHDQVGESELEAAGIKLTLPEDETNPGSAQPDGEDNLSGAFSPPPEVRQAQQQTPAHRQGPNAEGADPASSGSGLELQFNTGVDEAQLNGGSLAPEDYHQSVTEDFQANVRPTQGQQLEKHVPPPDQSTLGEDAALQGEGWEPYDPKADLSRYQYPTLELLNEPPATGNRQVNREELIRNKENIVETLRNFNIGITEIRATVGPTVTLYEIVPEPTVKISKVKGLEDDIAMRLKALRSRIIAPMPGRGTIGIEIPNSKPEIVSFRSLIATEKFRDANMQLPIAMGRTVSNEVFLADLAKMPHLLVAGATGQGKSVGLNGIIASLLYKLHPAQIKFVLIDPKKVEMTLYERLEQHFLAKLPHTEDSIITENSEALNVLNSLCIEMDDRYQLLKTAQTRNLLDYNTKFTARRLNPNKGHRYLPYIVLIIDELADLMMTAGKEVEQPICRLAQLARAVGIHLVVATQRPSVDIVTGKIKANFPARMSFRVISKADSGTILDSSGAEQLIGRGDMLFSAGSDLVRLQNAFIDTPEVEQLVDYIAGQQGYPEPYYLPEPPMDDSGDNPYSTADLDEHFAEAARLIVQHQKGSTSLIQRRMGLGYNRSGRIMDQLEKFGIVSAARGSKPRDVLVVGLDQLEQLLQDMQTNP